MEQLISAFGTLSLAGLVSIGAVNLLLMFRPNVDSRIKFVVQFIFAFAVLFIPTDISNFLLEKTIEALKITFAGSGLYKLVSKAGGN